MQVLRVSSQQRQQKNVLGIVTLVSLILQGANVVLLLGLLTAYFGLRDKEPPSMVQVEGGRTIVMEPMDSRDRTPAVIQRFVRDQLVSLLSASGQMPSGVIPGAEQAGGSREDMPPGMVPDPGVEISVDGEVLKVSTLARIASFAISEDFRSAFLRDLARRTPQTVFLSNGQYQRILIFQNISEPEPIAPGQWKVTVISSLVDFESGNPVGIPRPFNKEVFVQAVPVPVTTDFSSDLEKRIAEVRAAGLEIYAIRNYVRRNLSPSNVLPSPSPSASPSLESEASEGEEIQELESFIE